MSKKPDWGMRAFVILAIAAILAFAFVRAWSIAYEQQSAHSEKEGT